MGLSEACTNVLNTELQQCDLRLFARTDLKMTTSIGILSREDLDLICKPECREELAALRAKIFATCTSPQDVVRHAGMEFPPSLFVEKFAYTYDINCYKHESSELFCDELRTQWGQGQVKFDKCHGCYLGPLAAMISSPLGVYPDRIDHFNEVRAACKNTEFEPEIATRYGQPDGAQMRLASADEVEDTRSCARWYTMQEGDTCASVSMSQRTSTVNMIQKNALDINCGDFLQPGRKLCLDEPVDVHRIVPGDTCSSIAQKYSITERQFRSLNEMIDETCSNIARWEGYIAAVGPKSLFAGNSESGRFPEFSEKPARFSKAITPRKPLAPGSSAKCTMFVNGRALTDPDLVAFFGADDDVFMTSRNIKSFNRCRHVTDYNDIYIGEFTKMNPSLDPRDCYLDGQYSYCLAEEGGPKPTLPEGWNMQWGLRWG
ncbi:uncharacterized protein B0I36DRAFT_370077 [Microdochium trichocladiopsis]|uniref:LysM domain-containing protein n=1 Tax=Microdochium trichocladiopsis TaxID=1682393 RepID=A0A9P8XQ47_9PEZI|nr:uncharacterized protein B0I36DRAFT_370077 [Microdochium trichocladiopsis]KAH7010779.1 hypothetical protein B0I36DRAFT_370077 [Microdochium trichocladiopsis]